MKTRAKEGRIGSRDTRLSQTGISNAACGDRWCSGTNQRKNESSLSLHGRITLARPPGATSSARAPAVTLVELLLVLAVIAMLIGLLLPSLGHAREQVSRVMCSNNLNQWGKTTWYYRTEHDESLPREGTFFNLDADGTWFNELPPYLDLPPYRDFERLGDDNIRRRANIDVWICPSKNRTAARASQSGLNQFHYGLNQVLDGLGSGPGGSSDTPGFPDQGDDSPMSAQTFKNHPRTVWMFDIAPNSPAGTPRHVANRFQRNSQDRPIAEFHGDFANILYLDGAVGHCRADDLVSDRDFQDGTIRWNDPNYYWGYVPPGKP